MSQKEMIVLLIGALLIAIGLYLALSSYSEGYSSLATEWYIPSYTPSRIEPIRFISGIFLSIVGVLAIAYQ